MVSGLTAVDEIDPSDEGEVSIGTPVVVDDSETGEIVVEMAMVDVTRIVESAGQLVTVSAQLVTVAMEVA